MYSKSIYLDLTSINAWIRRIDQCAMLIGPALAGFTIGFDPKLGGGWIALWNIISLFFEIFILKKIYVANEAKLCHIRTLEEEISQKNSEKISENFMDTLRDWWNSWKLWKQSAVFVPGLALALLYTNVFQLSYIAQAYIKTHCISDNLMGLVFYSYFFACIFRI